MRKYVVLAAFCLVAAGLLIRWGLWEPGPKGGMGGRVALVLAEDTGIHIMKVKAGAQDAAGLMGAECTVFVAKGALPSQVVEGGYDGVLVMADTGMDLPAAAQALGDARLVLVGDAWEGLSIASDHERAGYDAAMALSLSPGDSVAILLWDGEPSGIAMDRLAGANKALLEMGCQGTLHTLKEGTPQGISGENPGGILALGERETLYARAAKAAGEIKKTLPLSGFAPGEDAAALLEEGLIDGLTVPMPYAMGYLGVMAALTGKAEKATYRTLTGSTLYDSENVSLAFPLLQ